MWYMVYFINSSGRCILRLEANVGSKVWAIRKAKIEAENLYGFGEIKGRFGRRCACGRSLIEEVDRVYATRYDCCTVPEGVRRVA